MLAPAPTAAGIGVPSWLLCLATDRRYLGSRSSRACQAAWTQSKESATEVMASARDSSAAKAFVRARNPTLSATRDSSGR
jgi:hypothetical protein